MRAGLWCALCLPLILAGCASGPPPPADSLLLAQVAHVATQDDVANGVRVDDTAVRVSDELLRNCGLARASVRPGGLAVVRFYYFWVSRVPQAVHSWAVVAEGTRVAPGDFVELQLKRGAEENGRCAFIVRTRASAQSGDCGFGRNERAGAGAVAGTVTGLLHALGGTGGGPPGSSSIYCKGLEQDGWTKHVQGPYDAIVWRRMPAP